MGARYQPRWTTLIIVVLVVARGHAQSTSKAAVVPAPTNLWAAQLTATEVRLVWRPMTGVSGFRVYRDPPAGQPGLVTVATLAANSSLHTVLLPTAVLGTTLQYYLEAFDAGGNVSPRVPFNKITIVGPSPLPVPQPASVTARETAAGQITVSWDPVPGATAYFIGRSVEPNGFNTLCGLCSTNTMYVDQPVINGTKYTYFVSAYTPAGLSKRTASNTVTPGTSATSQLITTGGGDSGRTGAGDTIDPAPAGGPGSITSTSGSPPPALPEGCNQEGDYTTCVSPVFQFSPYQVSQIGVVDCPSGGQVATGGGFSGTLQNMVVARSTPVRADTKTRAGWTVTVQRIIFPPQLDVRAALIQAFGYLSAPQFQVWVVCAPMTKTP